MKKGVPSERGSKGNTLHSWSTGVIDSTVGARLAHRYVSQQLEVSLILLCSKQVKNFCFLTTKQQKDKQPNLKMSIGFE